MGFIAFKHLPVVSEACPGQQECLYTQSAQTSKDIITALVPYMHRPT